MRILFIVFFLVAMISCNNNEKTKEQASMYKKTGNIERLDPALDSIIDSNAQPEIIAEGFEWSEGPLWIEQHNMLIFSDVPTNTIYKWTEENGKEVYLKPSGFTGSETKSKEPGSNGLLLDSKGNLVLCQHGDRRMARMDAPIDKPLAKFITLADSIDGKRFSSPNDAVYNYEKLFFTDPPYGLPQQSDDDPLKETSSNGVYCLNNGGTITVITDSLTRPNGLAFTGQNELLVANSDPDDPAWYKISFIRDIPLDPTLFYSVKGYDKKLKGLPDGLKIDKNGNVFATGPGGVYILNKDGKLLGKLLLEEASSNVALSPDEKIIYITNDMYVLRLKMRK